jgi:hypothetical protein
MAITQGFCVSAKLQFLTGSHTPLHTYKIALFTSAATLHSGSTAYSATNEVANGSGYTTGGQALVGYTSTTALDVAYLDWTTDPSWPTSTFTARGALIYNTSGSQAIAVLDFGADYTATNGTFTVTLPAPGTTAIIRSA